MNAETDHRPGQEHGLAATEHTNAMLQNFIIVVWFTVWVLHVIFIVRLKCVLVRSIHLYCLIQKRKMEVHHEEIPGSL